MCILITTVCVLLIINYLLFFVLPKDVSDKELVSAFIPFNLVVSLIRFLIEEK